MKKLIMTLALVVLATVASAQSLSTVGMSSPLPVVDGPIKAIVAPATGSITMSDTPQLIGTLPSGTRAVILIADGGAIYYGDSTITPALNSSTALSPMIATDAEKVLAIDYTTLSPSIYFCAAATSTTPILRIKCLK